jgi:hypothetical protein
VNENDGGGSRFGWQVPGVDLCTPIARRETDMVLLHLAYVLIGRRPTTGAREMMCHDAADRGVTQCCRRSARGEKADDILHVDSLAEAPPDWGAGRGVCAAAADQFIARV